MALPMGQLDKNNNIQSNAIDDERVPNNLSNEDVDGKDGILFKILCDSFSWDDLLRYPSHGPFKLGLRP